MLNIIISKKAAKLVNSGFPWIYKSDIENMNSGLEIAEPGELCSISDEKGKKIATGYFNPKTNIAVRVLTTNVKEKIDEEFFKKKIIKALERRRKYFKENYFRLVYGESDGLPGLIIDVYGEYAAAQVNSAGMAVLQRYWLPALMSEIELKGVYLDASGKHRIKEGLDNDSKVIRGKIPDVIEVKENGLTYFADMVEGQKTGWFYDQRDNRKFLASLAKDKTVLDLYTHSGGFGLLCAKHGAEKIVMVDRSELGLGLAEKAGKEFDNCEYVKADVFEYLDKCKEKFDIVNADPPAFIKNKKDVEAGLKGYEKLTRKSIGLVKEGGVFAISSCSYFARPEQFRNAVEKALKKSGRDFELIRKSGADKDHPIHPMLSETNYLKFLVYRL